MARATPPPGLRAAFIGHSARPGQQTFRDEATGLSGAGEPAELTLPCSNTPPVQRFSPTEVYPACSGRPDQKFSTLAGRFMRDTLLNVRRHYAYGTNISHHHFGSLGHHPDVIGQHNPQPFIGTFATLRSISRTGNVRRSKLSSSRDERLGSWCWHRLFSAWITGDDLEEQACGYCFYGAVRSFHRCCYCEIFKRFA